MYFGDDKLFIVQIFSVMYFDGNKLMVQVILKRVELKLYIYKTTTLVKKKKKKSHKYSDCNNLNANG
jgi:hypothetical protein